MMWTAVEIADLVRKIVGESMTVCVNTERQYENNKFLVNIDNGQKFIVTVEELPK